METMSKTPKTSTDRFSSLPDEIAHKVVSFLSMKDISRLSVVSKRCRQLCLSTPFLSFDVIPYKSDALKRAQFMNYLDRLLFLRKGVDTQDCHIRWCLESSFCPAEEEYRLLSLLHNAMTCNVKHLGLHVTLKSGSDLALPSSLLCCKSLESLTMSFDDGIGILKIPPSFGGTSGFSFLKCLRVTSVRIDGSFGEWISSYCKSLEELSLMKISGIKSITITSSSLKFLYICSDYELLHLHISAEKLTELVLAWTFNLPDGALQLYAPKLVLFMYWVKHLLEPQPAFDKNLVPALNAVAGSIIGLALNDDSILELLKLGCLPTLFTNLQLLQVCVTCSRDDLLPILISFLKRTPELHTLVIRKWRCHANANGVEDNRAMERWESRDVLFVQNLKVMKIELMSKGNSELELIKYFLKTAEDLQKMTVLYAPPLRSKVRNKIIRYKKASSNVKLEFHQL